MREATMSSCRAAKALALFALLSLFVQNECYISIVDTATYRTVNNFADECVKFKHFRGFFKNKKLREKLKKVIECFAQYFGFECSVSKLTKKQLSKVGKQEEQENTRRKMPVLFNRFHLSQSAPLNN